MTKEKLEDYGTPEDTKAAEDSEPKHKWLSVQNGHQQTGTGVPPGKGDEEAGVP
jgi:hypothetical protein